MSCVGSRCSLYVLCVILSRPKQANNLHILMSYTSSEQLLQDPALYSNCGLYSLEVTAKFHTWSPGQILLKFQQHLFRENNSKTNGGQYKLQKYQNSNHWRGETICVLCTVVRMVDMRCKHFSWPLVVTQETVVLRHHMFARDSEIVKLDNYCYRLLIHCVNKRQFLQDCDNHLARQDWFLWIHESGKWRILIVKCQRFYSNELDWTRCDEEVFMTWFCFYLWN